MSLFRLYTKGNLPSKFINKLRNNSSVIKQLQRHYSLLEQQTAGITDQFPQLHQTRRLHNLSRNFRNISSLLTRCGFRREANVARDMAVQMRCFSTSRPYRNRDDPDKEKHNDHDDDDKDDEGDEKEAMKQMARTLIRLTILMCFIYTLVLLVGGDDTSAEKMSLRNISWKEFYNELLLKGEVDKIEALPDGNIVVYVHHGAMVKGQQAIFNEYMLKLPDGNTSKFEEKVREAEKQLGIAPENGVSIHYRRITNAEKIIMNLIFLSLLLLLLRYSFKSVPMSGGTNIFDSVRKANFTRVDTKSQHGKVTFKDVAGLQEAKVEVMEFVDYLKNPKRYEVLGAKIPKGALLLGPPGCGKTLLAKAVATEAQVPFFAMAGSEFVEMLGGLGASRVRSLFQEARKSAPCIIYLDEIDAIGRKRGGSMEGSGEEEHTLNQLLVEMDGMGTTAGVIMLASTNRADVLDKALLRPGRFDRHITIDFPTLAERQEIFDMYLKMLKMKSQSTDFSVKLAKLTPGMTGADIANICNEAALKAARDKKTSIETTDFDYAVERVIGGVAKKTSVLSPAEKKIIAYHEAGHALVGWMLEHTDALLKISIIPRTSSALGFAQYAPSDRKLYTKEQLFEVMCMALGGRVAESLIFNRITTGAQDDLKKVTKIAYNQIRSFGMNQRVGHISFPDTAGKEFGTKPYSKRLAATIDEESQHLVARAYKHTEKLLQDNVDKLHLLATTLLKKEVMSYEEVEKLIGPPPHGSKSKVDLLETDILSNNTENNVQPGNFTS